jgi:hypothetical protein
VNQEEVGRYDQMRARYRATVVQRGLREDTAWGQPYDALNVQAWASPPLKDHVGLLQEELKQLLPADTRYVPVDRLHISVACLLEGRSGGRPENASRWEKIGAECLESLRDVCARARPARIRFERVLSTDVAVLLVGRDGGELDVLRRCIGDLMTGCGLEYRPKEIIHCTVARGGPTPGNGAELLHWADERYIDVEEFVGGVDVLWEWTYPSLATTTEARLELAGPLPRPDRPS